MELGMLNVCAVSPNTISIANPIENANYICQYIEQYRKHEVIVFPELCITGYSCADLFNQRYLIEQSMKAIEKIAEFTVVKNINTLIAVGAPIRTDNQLFNCAVLIQKGKILGVVPKTFIPNYNEFYEDRWFASGSKTISKYVQIGNQNCPFGNDLLFVCKDNQMNPVVIGVEICEDLWMPIPPSSHMSLHGANVILNLSASNDIVTKKKYREDIVRIQSAKCICGYIYCSAGSDESTTDVVFSGHKVVADNGSILTSNHREECHSFIDIDRINNDRIKYNSFMQEVNEKEYRCIGFTLDEYFDKEEFIKVNNISAYPFVPQSSEHRLERCREILQIQATGLAQRLRKIGCGKVVIGISGGLDSTLALLVAYEAFIQSKLDVSGILGITMPGFGTTNRTKNNADKLMECLGITSIEIPIHEACMQHLKDIDHLDHNYDITYENVQARERTQILFDMANKHNAIVVGTGDLSELALGWCTYNGDHMSNYAVNSSIPKTLVRYIIENYELKTTMRTDINKLKEILADILATPVSPELLPPDKDGNIAQVTEDSIGSYALHDFFLYHTIRNGFTPNKVYNLAIFAFSDVDKKVIKDTLKVFYKRFFTQQFKRSCLPDGPKVGSVCLSPRGDWRMPSDINGNAWINEIE